MAVKQGLAAPEVCIMLIHIKYGENSLCIIFAVV